jgi:hypothetical protein
MLGYALNNMGFVSREGQEGYLFFQNVHLGTVAHSASYSMDTEVIYRG